MADFTTSTSVTGTSTPEYLVAKTVDTVLNYSPATLFFLGKQKTWKGTQMRFPIKYQKNTEGMAYDGLQKFSTTKTSNFVYMTFSPVGREQPVVISGIEKDVNASNPTMDLVARQLASDSQDMADAIAGKFFTLQTGIEFSSLVDICDDGTIGATSYGNLSRTTYSGLAGNYADAGGNLTLTLMRTSKSNCTHGSNRPNLILTTKAVWSYYEKLLTPTLSTQVSSLQLVGYPSFVGATEGGLPNIIAPGTALKGNQGFTAIYYDGVPLIADEKCNTGYIYFLNTPSIAFYGLPSTMPGYKPVKFYSDTLDSVYNIPVTTGFSWSGFNTPIDQYGEVGHIILQGNLICSNPRLNGVLIGVTGA